MNSIYISIEGNIGSGKTTIIRQLKDKYSDRIIFIEEPIDDWKAYKDKNKDILKLYYEDQTKYGFMFQLIVIQTHLQQMRVARELAKERNIKLIISERSGLNRYIFNELLLENKSLTQLEYDILNTTYKNLEKEIMPDLYIYLKRDPKECYENIIIRNITKLQDILSTTTLDDKSKDKLVTKQLDHIKTESTITMEYLNQLHTKYENLNTSARFNTHISSNYQDIANWIEKVLL